MNSTASMTSVTSMAYTASDRKGAKTQYDISWLYPQKTFFQNIKIKLNSNAWMTLKSSKVIFKNRETSAASLTSAASATSLSSLASPALFPPRNSWSWWFDHHWHQNDQYWSLFVEWIIKNPLFHWYLVLTLSVGGCWGQQILLFWKLVDETQMSKPPESNRHHNSRKLSILLSLRAI